MEFEQPGRVQIERGPRRYAPGCQQPPRRLSENSAHPRHYRFSTRGGGGALGCRAGVGPSRPDEPVALVGCTVAFPMNARAVITEGPKIEPATAMPVRVMRAPPWEPSFGDTEAYRGGAGVSVRRST